MYGRGHAIAVVGAAAVSLGSTRAEASNGNTPRTPPVFFEQACLSVVDRSVDPVLHLDYSIPFEDAALTADEPADARRFQFFGVCRDIRVDQSLPSWLDQTDIDAALASGVLEESPKTADVLAGHPDYDVGHDGTPGTCVQTIVDAAGRVPITCEGITGGADWDTTGAPAGNYVVHGYTWAPVASLWTRRAGLVRVHDGDTAAIGPAVALTSPSSDIVVYESDGFPIVGCVDGGPGTTVSVQWTRIADIDDASTWQTLCGDVRTDDGTFAVTFVPPPEAVNQAIVFRAIATDDEGRSWTGHAPGRALVFPGDGDGDGPELDPGPDFCGLYPDAQPVGAYAGDNACAAAPGDTSDGGSSSDDGGGSTAGGGATVGSSTGDDGAGGDGSDGGGGGCGCASGHGRPTWWIFALALLITARRRTDAATDRPLCPDKRQVALAGSDVRCTPGSAGAVV